MLSSQAIDAVDLSGDLRGAHLAGMDLSGRDLCGRDLTGADLSECDLSGAELRGTCLEQATLFRCNLEGADLLAAKLRGADLTECKARQAGFGQAHLDDVRAFGANFQGATLSNATLSNADLRSVELQGARMRGADLSRVDLSGADLRDADLTEACALETIFDGADVRSATVTRIMHYQTASFIGADIRNVDFCRAYAMRRFIMDQNYLHEFRTRNRSCQVLYWLWWITSDCGRSFVRWGLCTLVVAVVFAGLYTQVAVDYGDHETALSPLYYSIVTLTTLGYGDVLPTSDAAQALVMIQVVIGYVMLGGMLSMFSNKMARRAE